MSQPGMTSLRLPLALTEAGEVLGSGGEAAFALSLELVRRVSASAARELHDHAPPKPFAIALHLHDAVQREGKSIWQAGRSAALWVRCVSGDAGLAVREAMEAWRERGDELPLAGTAIVPGPDPLQTDSRDYADLFEPGIRARRVTFDFLTPTSFRRQGRQVVLPLPELILGSLLGKWNAFSPIQFRPEIVSELAAVHPTRYSLRTESVRFSNYRIVGFKGRCECAVPDALSPVAHAVLCALTHYAEFAAVGYKTTMGMGVVRGRVHLARGGPGETARARATQERLVAASAPGGAGRQAVGDSSRGGKKGPPGNDSTGGWEWR